VLDQEARVAAVDRFVAALEGLHRADDRGSLARLKRCAGRELQESREVFGLFYRLLPDELADDYRARWLFLIATLFPLAPHRSSNDFGRALRELAARSPASEAGLDRRMSVLLDSSPDELSFRLRQMLTRLAAAEVRVDWRQLAEDVLRWDAPWRPVQKQWARSYFGGSTNTAPTTNENEG
jgi:CRISPR system Cascade subunit CasB